MHINTSFSSRDIDTDYDVYIFDIVSIASGYGLKKGIPTSMGISTWTMTGTLTSST